MADFEAELATTRWCHEVEKLKDQGFRYEMVPDGVFIHVNDSAFVVFARPVLYPFKPPLLSRTNLRLSTPSFEYINETHWSAGMTLASVAHGLRADCSQSNYMSPGRSVEPDGGAGSAAGSAGGAA